MRQEIIHYFTETEDEFVNRLVKMGTRKNVATVLVYLANLPKATSHDIERGTDMRQPEISTAMKYLIDRGWIRTYDSPAEKKGRPVKIYELARPIAEIIDRIGREKNEMPKNKLAFIRKLRDHHDRTLQVLTAILIFFGVATLVWSVGISLPANPAPSFLAPPETSAPAAAPVPLSPGSASGQQIPTLTPLLQWSAVNGADYYTVEVSRSPYGPGDLIYSSAPIRGTSVTVPGNLLVPGITYRWVVQAHSGNVAGNVSAPLCFTAAVTAAVKASTGMIPA
jgi:predicted transcriptional regulator